MSPESSGQIRTTVTVDGDVSGQLAVGSNIVQMRVDTVHGNLVTVLPPGTVPQVNNRPSPVRLLPRKPASLIGRQEEIAEVDSELRAGRSVEIHGRAGIGKSAILRYLAHAPELGEADVAHLSARNRSYGELLQCIFDAFYSCDIPFRPAVGQLGPLLQDVRAVILIDDAELSADEVSNLADIVPNSTFLLGSRVSSKIVNTRSVELVGLPDAKAMELLTHALGRPLRAEEVAAADALCGLARGTPGHLLELGHEAQKFRGSLRDFAAHAIHSWSAAENAEPAEDLRLLTLIAAHSGLEADPEQLALVYHEPTGTDSPTMEAGRRKEQRRALDTYFLEWARANEERITAIPESAEPLRFLLSAAVSRSDWQYVLALGAVLDSVYASSGFWDSWSEVGNAMLGAARSLGDGTAEATALHQLGTQALCTGDLHTATDVFTAALKLREAIGDTVGATVTKQNLSLVNAVPPVAPAGNTGRNAPAKRRNSRGSTSLSRIPAAVRVLVVLIPMLAGIAFIASASGSEPARVEVGPRGLDFGNQFIMQPSTSQSVTVRNAGRDAVHVKNVTVAGRDAGNFALANSACPTDLPSGGSCQLTVVFTPVRAGQLQAALTISVMEFPEDLTAGLSGSATAPDATVSPNQLDFAEQPVRVASEVKQVGLIAPAIGQVSVGETAISGADPQDFGIDADNCSKAQLSAVASCTVGIRFLPTAEGSRAAVLTLTRLDGAAAVSVQLTGIGRVPHAKVAERQILRCNSDEVMKNGRCVTVRPTCEENEELKDGQCVEIVPTCDDNETLQDGECVAVVPSCGKGTSLQNGRCVVVPRTSCGDSATCTVSPPSVVCGEGKSLQNGQCVVVPPQRTCSHGEGDSDSCFVGD